MTLYFIKLSKLKLNLLNKILLLPFALNILTIIEILEALKLKEQRKI